MKTITIYKTIYSDETSYSVLLYSYNKPTSEKIQSLQRFKDLQMDIENVVLRVFKLSVKDIEGYKLNAFNINDIKKYLSKTENDSIQEISYITV